VKGLLEILFYISLVLAVTFGLKQLEGIDAGRMKPGVPTFFDFMKESRE
jgi:hypothetical protein